MLPIDASTPIRLDAAARLTHRAGAAQTFAPTELQRGRLTLLLRILDAEEAGLSKREIAQALVYPNLPALHGATWKGSAERRRVHRLSLDAARLRDAGGRDLLLGSPTGSG